MPNKTVEALMHAVDRLQADVEWLKKGMLGMYAAFSVGMVTIVTALLLK